MRPYFEVKVVKAKKVKKTKCKDECVGSIVINQMSYSVFLNKNSRTYYRSGKSKGNWVNGENLDKIKFPVPCTHKDKSNGYSGYGMLMTGLNHHMDKTYILADIGKQRNELTTVSQSESLKDLIETWDIHILKGKIILFEED